ncbi:chitooligosaccharide deacetylase [Anaerobacillus arseniciselenatis]|uniref:Chitooligosaccharide deacetylase n=1 Tax=Anaerobacillus arseniciselenatis TaxID=85682 RepID=A0A1S2LIS7_9BACI|nr:polysaccharide deacetylase family protein [Anaerobacillus arseniciselenatis]OIJ12286.1 chitooligosaccharide deacetylase [Anaerobacillus arseniciselenatis]
MNNRIWKLMLILLLVVGAQLSVVGVGHANEVEELGKVEQQWWWKKDRDKETPPEDLPRLGGGSENPERIQEQPISNIILQQRYPETVFLQGPETENKIAITFDDGPDPRFSEQVLDVLAEYNVPATFFVMGSRAIAYPEIVERMVAEGHIIGNHTYFHPNLVKEGDLATLEREVTRTEDTLNDIIGYRTKLFRAPYGFLYNELVEKLAEMTYSIIVWSVDSLDWQEDPPEVIADNVTNNVHPGAIILMHDGGDWDDDRTNTIASLREIIPTLLEQGYEFVTVPELLNIPYQK